MSSFRMQKVLYINMASVYMAQKKNTHPPAVWLIQKIMLQRSEQVLKKQGPHNPCMHWTVYAKQQTSEYLNDNKVSHPYTIP
jgi:hypothetical protein